MPCFAAAPADINGIQKISSKVKCVGEGGRPQVAVAAFQRRTASGTRCARVEERAVTRMDVIIRRGRLLDREGLWDIGLLGDTIAAVAPTLDVGAALEIEAGGNLVTPTYVNAHVHLDKCNLGDVMRPNRTNSFQECLEITWEQKRTYTIDDIVERASRAIAEGIQSGTTVFRVFADVDTIGGLVPLEGILALKEQWKGIVRIEAVAFPQEAIVRDPGAYELMEEGMGLGADIVGGLPWHEHLDEDAHRHIDLCFALAKRYDKDIHMLVDDTDNPLSSVSRILGRKDTSRRLSRPRQCQSLRGVGLLRRSARS